jgi:hypothetical protein
VLLWAPRRLAAESGPRGARALLAPMSAWPAGPAAMGAMPAARAVGAAGPAVDAARSLAAARSEGVAVDFALTMTALAESTLAAGPVRASPLPVAEGLAVPVAVPGWRGAMHGELGDRPRRRVALDAGQRGPDESAMKADFGVRRRRLVGRGIGRRGRLVLAGLRRRSGHGARDRLLRGGRSGVDGRKGRHLAGGRKRRRPRDGLLPAADRDLSAPVLVLGVAGRAPDLADVVADERHHRMVAQPPLARTIVIDEITNPKLARMHAQSLLNSNPGALFG